MQISAVGRGFITMASNLDSAIENLLDTVGTTHASCHNGTTLGGVQPRMQQDSTSISEHKCRAADK